MIRFQNDILGKGPCLFLSCMSAVAYVFIGSTLLHDHDGSSDEQSSSSDVEPTSVAYALWASCVPIELQEDLWRVIGSRVCTPICGMLGVPCGYVPVPRPREAARD